ncbi:hypothetical protein CSOJ01_11737 [Colletotrichum sojae]|uniref:Uncharacterized protein n=1 Tax=Colletotrichum sojae TaxID=2175907 RepID=A0A8H6MMN4_9PEZI|nr:hypothetical protein CSOJ01_11737 [Colletotrichum sojae]
MHSKKQDNTVAKLPSSEQHHYLYLARGPENTFTVNLAEAKGHSVPLYTVTHNYNMSKMEIRRLPSSPGPEQHRPIGAIKLRAIPPRVDVTLRGTAFRMVRPHALSKNLAFSFLGAPEMRWERLPVRARGIKLVDFNGAVRGHFRPRMRLRVLEDDFGGGWGVAEEIERRQSAGMGVGRPARGPGFELYASRLADLDLDLIVTTGLAAAEYRRQLQEDWDDVAE